MRHIEALQELQSLVGTHFAQDTDTLVLTLQLLADCMNYDQLVPMVGEARKSRKLLPEVAAQFSPLATKRRAEEEGVNPDDVGLVRHLELWVEWCMKQGG